MKYCSHCGNEVLDEAVICPKCGCSVSYGGGVQVGQQMQPAADSYSGLSIAGFILSFVESLIGLILCIVAYNEAKKTGSQKSLGLARAGIIISAVIMGLAVLAVIVYIIIICIIVFSFAGAGMV